MPFTERATEKSSGFLARRRHNIGLTQYNNSLRNPPLFARPHHWAVEESNLLVCHPTCLETATLQAAVGSTTRTGKVGLEPTASSLTVRRSTIELLANSRRWNRTTDTARMKRLLCH